MQHKFTVLHGIMFVTKYTTISLSFNDFYSYDSIIFLI